MVGYIPGEIQNVYTAAKVLDLSSALKSVLFSDAKQTYLIYSLKDWIRNFVS